MVKMCIPVVIALLGGATIVTLGVLDSLMIAGEQAVAQNETSQDDKVSRSSNNVSDIYTGTGNNALNFEVLTIVEQCTEMSRPAPVRHPGQPFTVAYSLDAVAKPATSQN